MECKFEYVEMQRREVRALQSPPCDCLLLNFKNKNRIKFHFIVFTSSHCHRRRSLAQKIKLIVEGEGKRKADETRCARNESFKFVITIGLD